MDIGMYLQNVARTTEGCVDVLLRLGQEGRPPDA
jgi:hypothetical protein